MSAALVRKSLDETTLDGKLEKLSKTCKKKFKPVKKKKIIPAEKLLKQNLKILKSLEYKIPTRGKSTSSSTSETVKSAGDSVSKKKSKKSKKTEYESGFTEDDFEKFEKEYFIG